MLNTGIFPNQLKILKMVPIYKKDDEILFPNYTPISVLPLISNIFEKIIFHQLYDHFKINNIFYIVQYGFRKEHSTEIAAYELINRLIQDLDKNNTTFDTLDHLILLDKHKYYGIRGVALNLLTSYLKIENNMLILMELNQKSEQLLLVFLKGQS